MNYCCEGVPQPSCRRRSVHGRLSECPHLRSQLIDSRACLSVKRLRPSPVGCIAHRIRDRLSPRYRPPLCRSYLPVRDPYPVALSTQFSIAQSALLVGPRHRSRRERSFRCLYGSRASRAEGIASAYLQSLADRRHSSVCHRRTNQLSPRTPARQHCSVDRAGAAP
jgi:hypothetical protein